MNKNILEIIGKNVKTYREKRNLSVEKVSDKTGIRKEYLKKIEEGIAFRVMPHHLIKIAELLKVDLHILFK